MTNLLISLFIKDKENVKDAKVRNAYGKMAGIVPNFSQESSQEQSLSQQMRLTIYLTQHLLLSHLSDLEWLENQQMKIIHSDMEGWNMYQDLLYLS